MHTSFSERRRAERVTRRLRRYDGGVTTQGFHQRERRQDVGLAVIGAVGAVGTVLAFIL